MPLGGATRGQVDLERAARSGGACRGGPCCGPAWRVTEAAGQVGSARGPQKKGEQQPARAGGKLWEQAGPFPPLQPPRATQRSLLPTTPLPPRSTPLPLPFSPRSSPGGDPSPPVVLLGRHSLLRTPQSSHLQELSPPAAPPSLPPRYQDAAARENYTPNAFSVLVCRFRRDWHLDTAVPDGAVPHADVTASRARLSRTWCSQ